MRSPPCLLLRVIDQGAHLVKRITDFGRLLRAAGMPIGSAAIADATQAVALAGLNREDFRAALAATLINRQDDLWLFGEAFNLFWRPVAPYEALADLLPEARIGPQRAKSQTPQRLADAMREQAQTPPRKTKPREKTETLRLAPSQEDQRRTRDFESMSAEEVHHAIHAAAALAARLPQRLSRRPRLGARGDRLALRAMTRAMRHGDLTTWRRLAPRKVPAPLVALCDISGSMGVYSRVFMAFLHGLAHAGAPTEVFAFGSQLTRLTHAFAAKDCDQALARAARAVPDWNGGTRIGEALRRFNLHWVRRVLAQGGTALLITDGLERGDGDAIRALAQEAERLRRATSRLIWLNPLLRWDGFEARARGVQALLPVVDDFLPVHNLMALEDLASKLARAWRRAPSAMLRAHA